MLSFFSKIRLKLAAENKPVKYMRYALGEILLVVIGILIALHVNNWNEKRKLHRKEVKLLQELKVNLKTNVSNLNSDISKQIRSTKSIESLLVHLDNHSPFNDSISRFFVDADYAPDVVLSSSAFETLKSVGLEIISSDNLRIEIIDLYEVIYPTLMMETRRLEDQVWPSAVVPLYQKHFRQNTGKVFPVDYEALLRDTEMKNMLSFRRVLRISSTVLKTEARNKTENVIQSIDEYLNVKENE